MKNTMKPAVDSTKPTVDQKKTGCCGERATSDAGTVRPEAAAPKPTEVAPEAKKGGTKSCCCGH